MQRNIGCRGIPIGFAHRGARSERRENTLDAFQRALELGASGLESDAWISADGVVILDHDGVTGPPWRRRAVATQARTDLPSHIPSLAELYRECGGGFELSLDVKDPRALPAIVEVANRAGALERLWLCHDYLGILTGWRPLVGSAHLVLSRAGRWGAEGLPALAATLRAAGVDAVNLRAREWDPERVGQVHEAGLLAFGWDAQLSGELLRLVLAGLDGVYSDHVDRMMAAIRQDSEGADS